MVRRLFLGLLLWPLTAAALPPERAKAMISAARAALGVRYQLGGRLRAGEGLDCQGLLFLAAQAASRCGWKSYSVYPTRTVAVGELGEPVAGMSPVRSSALEVEKLLPGDVLFLVARVENPAEAAIGTLDGEPVWVWHTGLYTGDGKWLNADPFAGEVTETSLPQYLVDHAYDGVYVLRIASRPRPARCREHPPMKAPARSLPGR